VPSRDEQFLSDCAILVRAGLEEHHDGARDGIVMRPHEFDVSPQKICQEG
jgi:hypothetical protein